jgi:hypothetical protein
LIGEGNFVGGKGVIEQIADVDYFSFQTLAGDVSFTLDVAPFGAMLDASLSLFDSTGFMLAEAATASLGESLSLSLPGGWYSLAVSSAGGYGDIGQYFLSGTIIAVPEPAFAGLAAVGLVMLLRRGR